MKAFLLYIGIKMIKLIKIREYLMRAKFLNLTLSVTFAIVMLQIDLIVSIVFAMLIFLLSKQTAKFFFIIGFLLGALYLSMFLKKVDLLENSFDGNSLDSQTLTIVEAPEVSQYNASAVASFNGTKVYITNIPKYSKINIYDKIKISGVVNKNKLESNFDKYLYSKKIFFTIKPSEFQKLNSQPNFFSSIIRFKTNLTKKNYRKFRSRKCNFGKCINFW